MGELMQNPKPAEHGRFLQKDSVLGDRVDFVSESDYVTARLTLQAAGNVSLQDFGVFTVSLSYHQDGNTLDWASLVGWNYCNFYIDGASSTVYLPGDLYRYGADAQSTRGRRSLVIYPGFDNDPGIVSHITRWYCQNPDSSSHTIDIVSIWKYIKTGNNFVIGA